MAGVFDFLHLKSNTKGSSNELSFDVLDAARNNLDSKKRKGSRYVISTPETIKPVASKPQTAKPLETSTVVQEQGPIGQLEQAAPTQERKSREEKREEKRREKERKKNRDAKMLETSTNQVVKASRGTSHGVKKNASLSTVPEVERRKKIRQAHRVRIGVIVAALVVVAVGVGVFFGYRYYQGRITFENRYAEMVDGISDVDKSLVELDAILSKSPDDVTDEDVARIEELVPRAKEGLQRVEPQIDVLANDASREKDVLALGYADSAVKGRYDMIGYVERLIGLYTKANKAVSETNEAWSAVGRADQLARESIEEANVASTEDAFNASSEKTRQAIEQFDEARKQLEDVVAIYEGIDFSLQLTYLDKRKEALEHELLVNEALLAGDRQKAGEENDAYNEADEEASHLASNLPATPSAQARSSYDTKIASVIENYKKSREAVALADANVRSYLASRTA